MELRALSSCHKWPARPVSSHRKRNNLRGTCMIISGILLEEYISLSECVVEVVLTTSARSGRSVLSNGKRPKLAM